MSNNLAGEVVIHAAEKAVGCLLWAVGLIAVLTVAVVVLAVKLWTGG